MACLSGTWASKIGLTLGLLEQSWSLVPYIPLLWNIEWVVVCAFRNQSCAFNSTNFCSSDSSHTGASSPPPSPFFCNNMEVHEQPVFHPSFWKQKICKLVLIGVSCCKGKVIEKLCQMRPNISCNNFWRWQKLIHVIGCITLSKNLQGSK